jgi:hypothetical protein
MHNQVTINRIQQPFNTALAPVLDAPGKTIAELAPPGMVMCRLNGGPGWILRKDWGYRTQPGDIVEFLEFPQGGEDDGGILQLVLAAVVSIVTLNPAPIFLAALQQFIALGYDSSPPELRRESPTYTTGLQGNKARLYEAIPKLCGRVRFYPPYAGEPYQEFDANGDQYLFALMALSIDGMSIERTQIDDTDISHFQDVLTVQYLPPGTLPQTVRANVINSVEVGGQELLTGQIVGAFNCCPALFTVARLGIDVTGPRGIGLQDEDGNLNGLEIMYRIEIADINEFGTRISPWEVLEAETFTRASREVQRFSGIYDIYPPRRIQARVIRMDVKSSNMRALNELVWSGMRAYLAEDAPLNPDVAHLEVVMRSNEQLTGISQNRIAVVGTGLVPELLPDGTRGSYYASRNAADYLADLWLSTTWGLGLEEAQVDTQTLVTLKALWAQRQDRFDYIFDSSIDAMDAAQIIAGSGRARVFRRDGVYSVWRDQLQTIGRTAFHTRNTLPGSMSDVEELPRERTPDGVIVEYFDNRAFNFAQPIECPSPGVVSMVDPVRIRLLGITGRTHAMREGLFEAAKLSYRRRTVGCTVEMQGRSAVRWQSEHTRWVAGDVVDYDEATLTVRLTEPPDWSQGTLQIVFIRDDGSLTEAANVTPGALTTQVVLPEAPDFDLSYQDGYRDRTQYMIGLEEEDDFLAIINSISDGGMEDGAQLYDIAAFVDDPRMHQVDLHLLPSPGEIQDPIDTTPGEGGGGTVPVVNITPHDWSALTFEGGNAISYARFNENGTLYVRTDGNPGTGFLNQLWPQEWLYVNPVELDVTAQFELRATVLTQYPTPFTWGTFDTWLPMNVPQEFGYEGPAPGLGAGGIVLFEVRDVASGIIQDSAIIHLFVSGYTT